MTADWRRKPKDRRIRTGWWREQNKKHEEQQPDMVDEDQRQTEV